MDEIIYGKNSVLEALIAGDREINKILISKNNRPDVKLNKIKELAKEHGIVFQFVAKEKFSQYSEFNHQGIIAQISPIKYLDLDDFLENKHSNESLIILDGIEDSHNVGAIIRTAVCAGVSGIIIPSRRNVQINSIVEKTSAGAINHIPIIKVNSLINAIQKFHAPRAALKGLFFVQNFSHPIDLLLHILSHMVSSPSCIWCIAL